MIAARQLPSPCVTGRAPWPGAQLLVRCFNGHRVLVQDRSYRDDGARWVCRDVGYWIGHAPAQQKHQAQMSHDLPAVSSTG